MPSVAIVESSPPARKEQKEANGKPSSVSSSSDGERATRIDELQRKLERLQGMIEGLKDEVKKRAMEDAGAGTMDPICNTCLDRKKGAALYPCGHTFCWKCTSELRRGRGPCPSCNQNFWNVLSISAKFPSE